MDHIPFISKAFIEANTDFEKLIKSLEKGFKEGSIETPLRHHHDYKNPPEKLDSTLLLMPSWRPGKDLGVKVVTVSPENGKYKLPSIQGTYIYMDGHQGSILGIFDAKALTAKRTAAASALASSFLSRKNSSTLLMLGTGALCTNLIKAHASVRPIQKVFLWGRNFDKSNQIALDLSKESINVIPVKDYVPFLHKADIISSATLSEHPLVFGQHLVPGQHLDLVGAYKKNMREADDLAVKKSSIFLDTFQGGLKESGDIVIPIKKGILSEKEIKADLFDLCSKSIKGRVSADEITFFKSVGHASEDLIAANYYFDQWKSKK